MSWRAKYLSVLASGCILLLLALSSLGPGSAHAQGTQLHLPPVGEDYYDVVQEEEPKGAARVPEGKPNRYLTFMEQVFVGAPDVESAVGLAQDPELGRPVWKATAGKPRWVNPKARLLAERQWSRREILSTALRSAGLAPGRSDALAEKLDEEFYGSTDSRQQDLAVDGLWRALREAGAAQRGRPEARPDVQEARPGPAGEEALRTWLAGVPEDLSLVFEAAVEGRGYWLLTKEGDVVPRTVKGSRAHLLNLKLTAVVWEGRATWKEMLEADYRGAENKMVELQATCDQEGTVLSQESTDPELLRVRSAEFVRVDEVKLVAERFFWLACPVRTAAGSDRGAQEPGLTVTIARGFLGIAGAPSTDAPDTSATGPAPESERPPEDAPDQAAQPWSIREVQSVNGHTVVTVAIPDPEEQYRMDDESTVNLKLKGKAEKVPAEGLLIEGGGFMGGMVNMVPLDTCAVVISRESTRALGRVPMNMTYRDFEGLRYDEDGELLLPLVFAVDVPGEQIESVELFGHVVSVRGGEAPAE